MCKEKETIENSSNVNHPNVNDKLNDRSIEIEAERNSIIAQRVRLIAEHNKRLQDSEYSRRGRNGQILKPGVLDW